MSYKEERKVFKEYKQLPYTLVGHTSLLKSFNMTFKAGGLKKLLKDVHDESLIHLGVNEDGTPIFEISEFIEKESKKK